MEAGRIEQFNKSKRTISVQSPPPPPHPPPIQGRPAVKEKITGSERPNYSRIPHGDESLRDYTVRGQSNVWRLPKYWPPHPLTARRVCTPRTGGHTRWVERGVGGQ